MAAALRRQGHAVTFTINRDAHNYVGLARHARSASSGFAGAGVGVEVGHMARTHLIGLLLGTEEDWSGAFEALLARIAPSRRARRGDATSSAPSG